MMNEDIVPCHWGILM